jgi:peroxiredoxin
MAMRNHAFGWIVLAALGLARPVVAQDPATASSAEVKTNAPEAEKPTAAERPDEPSATPSGPLPGHSYHGEVFDEGPRQKAYLMTGMPKIHFPVTTKSVEAQAFVQQGIGQLHGFWYYEAERSFRQAAVLDKECAMAYWGMAQANIDNGARGKKFMDECLKHKQGISERERMYIDAAEAYFKVGNKADKEKKLQRNQAYSKALERLLYKYPDDVEAKAFLALQLWKQRDEGPAINSYLAINALLDQIFQGNPMHPAHHYRIHLWDAEKADNGLGSAALCGQTSPGIAHMWHMPGHIYSKTKRYEDACWQQEASARVDHAHMLRDRVMPDQIHNYAHNNEWLIRDMIFVGRMRDAIGLAKNMCELPRHPKYNTLTKGSAKFGRQRLVEVLTRFEQWNDLIALCDTPYLEPTDIEAEINVRLRALGVAHYRRGDTAKGDIQLAALEDKLSEQKAAQEKAVAEAEEKARTANKTEKQIEKAKADAKKAAESKITDLTKAVNQLKGHKAVAAGEYKTALDHFQDTGIDQDVLAWVEFQAGDAAKAVKTAEEAVKSRKNEVIPLARLVELLWLAGKKDDAKKALEQLRWLSNSIDERAPFFGRIAVIAKELGYAENWKVVKPPLPDTGIRPPLDWLGPLHWQPSAAPAWTLRDMRDGSHSLGDYHGKPVIVLFSLGYGCLHCAKQLQAFGEVMNDIRAAGLDVVAISSDDADGLKQSFKNYQGAEIPFPLLSDSELSVFKSYRCFDDFEQQPLHGTFVVDGAGLVRWQDIGPEPFMDTKFLVGEAPRLLAQ